MGKDRKPIDLTPERMQIINYITDEGAAFNQELAEFTRRWITDVDEDLQYLVDRDVVVRVPSEYFPDHRWADIFKASNRAYEIRRDSGEKE